MKHWRIWSCVAFLALVAGCPTTPSQETNPYLTLIEQFPVLAAQVTTPQPGGTQAGAQTAFRRTLTITLRNNHPAAELNVSLMAWVNLGSIRSADQQDALLAGGFTQLGHDVRLGTAFTLPVGTYVYQGEGTAGATRLVLGRAQKAQGGAATPTTKAITLITPDVVLAFEVPPVSCDSIAFFYTDNGLPLTSVPVDGAEAPYAGSTRDGGYKTLAMVDVYQCDPLHPGYFLSPGGAARQANEYLEGQDITIDFNATPDAQGKFAKTTFATPGGTP